MGLPGRRSEGRSERVTHVINEIRSLRSCFALALTVIFGLECSKFLCGRVSRIWLNYDGQHQRSRPQPNLLRHNANQPSVRKIQATTDPTSAKVATETPPPRREKRAE